MVVAQLATSRTVVVGGQAKVVVRYVCATRHGRRPIVGLRVTARAAPLADLPIARATHRTSPEGVVVYVGVAARPGPFLLDLRAHVSTPCGLGIERSACAFSVRLDAAPRARRRRRGQVVLHGILPPANPTSDAPAIDAAGARCATAPRRADAMMTPACARYFISGIDVARAGEGVAPLRLPSDWIRLTVAERLFVLADLERVSRGLPPYVGLSLALDRVAAAGARAGADPVWSSPGVAKEASAWVGDVTSPLAADYMWIYDDGFGSSNASCTSPGAQGCWQHRDVILGRYTGLRCTDCVMGAANATSSSGQWRASMAEIIAAPVRPGALSVYFTWARDVLPYLGSRSPS